MRIEPLALCAVTLCAGCYEFEGDLGRLGFVSNLQTSGGAWTPEHAVSEGSRARFVASARLDREGEEAPQVVGRAEGLDWWEEEGALVVEAEGRRGGWVRFAGEVEDHFFVDVARPDSADLVEPLAPELDGRRLALASGGEHRFSVAVLDRRGNELGWDPADLAVRSEGGVAARLDGGRVVLGAVGESEGDLRLSLNDQLLLDAEVVIVDPGDVAELSVLVERFDVDGQQGAVAQVVGWLGDGTPVWGLPVSWDWTGGEGEVLAEGESLAVSLDRGSVQLEAAVGSRVVEQLVE